VERLYHARVCSRSHLRRRSTRHSASVVSSFLSFLSSLSSTEGGSRARAAKGARKGDRHCDIGAAPRCRGNRFSTLHPSYRAYIDARLTINSQLAIESSAENRGARERDKNEHRLVEPLFLPAASLRAHGKIIAASDNAVARGPTAGALVEGRGPAPTA